MENLRKAFDSLIWIEDDDWANYLYSEYCRLLAAGQDDGLPFGTDQFWNQLFPADSMDVDIQQGGGQPVPQVEPMEADMPEPSNAAELPQASQVDDEQPGPSHVVVPEEDPHDFYTMHPVAQVHVRRFNTVGRSYTVNFHNMVQSRDLYSLVPRVVESVLNEGFATAEENDLVGLEITHPSLDTPIIVPFCRRPAMTAERVLSIIERVAQSKTSLSFADSEPMVFRLVIVTPPAGTGQKYPRSYFGNWADWFKHHTGHGGCILQIKNDDNLCCARAIVTAKAYEDKDPGFKTVKNGDQGRPSSVQKRRAEKLMQDAGMQNHVGPCEVPRDVQKLQDALPEYQIKVFAKEQMNCLIYEGPVSEKRLHLYLHDDHFDVITSVPAFMGRSYWCHTCNQGYSNIEDHQCERGECPCCDGSPKCQFDHWVHCDTCNRSFLNQHCFDNHKNPPGEHQETVCEKIQKCKECGVLLNKRWDKKHVCGFFECSICHEYTLRQNHQCFIQPVKDKKKKKKNDERRPVFIFFDFETTQENEVNVTDLGPVYQHVPNLCVAQRVCDDCRNNSNMGTCLSCGDNQHVFKGVGCLDKFCEWLFREENRGATAIAHNARAFDSQFIMEYLHRQGATPPTVVTKGLQLMMIEAGGVRIIDSLNFLPMPLAAMPKTFGEDELKKGYFPHFFNKAENWNYSGELPDAQFYGPSSMKDEARDKFYTWYNKEKAANKVFNFKEELEAYCISDVDILRRCSLKFRDIFVQETGVDPFMHSLTIASACNLVFRRNFLKYQEIGIVPTGGYRREDKQSIIALKYLKWVSQERNIRIQHKLNGGEVQIGKYKVDGLLISEDPNEKEIFEVNGCWWHGCPRCVKNRGALSADKQFTMAEKYQRTIDRRRFLESSGYKVTETWECDMRRELAANVRMQEFFDETEITEPITGREAFFGGRTNSIKLYHKCEEGQKISYVDVCSLYPFVCKNGLFPVGHPDIITENFAPTTRSYKGLIKCVVLPPRALYHPVLPSKHNGKLMFPLCHTCAENLQQEKCEHTDEERALTGTWVHLELNKAIEKGYRVVKILEVWNYTEFKQYNPATKYGGLFSEYINTFLRLKQQSDGWPASATTDEEKAKYIEEYEKVEGVKLDPTKIEKNPGLRALAKLCLNSFWGKFGQRSNMTKTEYFTEPAEFFETVFDPMNVVQGVRFYGEHLACVPYTHVEDFIEELANTNVVIAAFVTAQARLKLYSYLEKLDRRVLYMDTDSIIYLTAPDDTYDVPTGCFLGEMTNELKGYSEQSFIKEYVGAGPKNYGYRVWDPTKKKMVNETLKVRGFHIDYATGKSVNFGVLRRMVESFVVEKEEITKTVVQNRILREKNRNVVTKTCKKDYRVVYDKRVILPDFTTIPYGF